MHRNSFIAWKIMNPIFIALQYLTLHRKNTKVDKKTNMPLEILYMLNYVYLIMKNLLLQNS